MTTPQKDRSTKRFKLILEYDGTRYSGWQKQDDARTIQGSLLTAAAEIFAGEVDIQGNGRTDAGVHALHYVAHLEAVGTAPKPEAIMIRLNELLPPSIAVLAVEACHPRFHARHSCLGRSYLYQVSRRKTAFGKKYVWWVHDHLDVAAMAEAAALFQGMHDFVSFAEKQELKKSTQVLVNASQVYEEDDMIIFRVVGSHFLWKMIRRLAGVLVEVGRHNFSVSDVEALLLRSSDVPTRFTAPPSGLFFEHAFYDQDDLASFLAEITNQP
jgi:tRNA pseudouridine38-40 synthase